jgi:hypothetical protein
MASDNSIDDKTAADKEYPSERICGQTTDDPLASSYSPRRFSEQLYKKLTFEEPSADLYDRIEETISRFDRFKEAYGIEGVRIMKSEAEVMGEDRYVSPAVHEHLLQSFHQTGDDGRGLVSTVVDYPPHVAAVLQEYEERFKDTYGCLGRKQAATSFDHSYFTRTSKKYEIHFPVYVGIQKFWGKIQRDTAPGSDWKFDVKDLSREF